MCYSKRKVVLGETGTHWLLTWPFKCAWVGRGWPSTSLKHWGCFRFPQFSFRIYWHIVLLWSHLSQQLTSVLLYLALPSGTGPPRVRWQLWQLLSFLPVLSEGCGGQECSKAYSHVQLTPGLYLLSCLLLPSLLFDGVIDGVVSVGTVTLIPQGLEDSSLVPIPPCSLTTRKPVE